MKFKNDLLYRRQFILSPKNIERFSEWQKAIIGGKFNLYCHPELEFTQLQKKNITLILLGYMLDPFNPDFANDDILKVLIKDLSNPDLLFTRTEKLGGRWILIYETKESIILFNDATGLRSVYYTSSITDELWCASQPGIIADELNYNVSDEGKTFINSSYVKNTKEYWWVGESTPYSEVKHLIPNYYLNLQKKESVRFWPNKKIESMTQEEIVTRSSTILKGLMKAANNRFDLAFSISCGWDSRVLLAASKEVSNNIYFFSLIYYNLTNKSPDIMITKKLLSKLGLKHHVITCPQEPENEFKKIYMENVSTAHNEWCKIAQGLHNYYPPQRVCIKGTISSEVIKMLSPVVQYRKSLDVDAKIFQKMCGKQKDPLALKYLGKWLLQTKSIASECNYSLYSLMGWELMTGNWQSMSQAETDIIYEVFSPYNNRELLTLLLSTDIKYRDKIKPKLYIKLMKKMWSEVLSEPINPISIEKKIKYHLIRMLVRINLYKKYV